MRVLGIDPGSRRTGWGVVDRVRGQNRLVAAGVIDTDPSADMSVRLTTIHAGLQAVFAAWTPDAVAIEEIFAYRSAASALVLGQARGVALLVAGLAGHRPHTYNAMTIKRSVTGSGTATKAGVQRMVAVLVGQEVPGPHDAADAVALALTHHAHQPASHAAARARVERPYGSGGGGGGRPLRNASPSDGGPDAPAEGVAPAPAPSPRHDAIAEALAQRARAQPERTRGALPANARLGPRKGWR
jgi:crossover junction endodeoxyribonuclease RuvC